ncbi:zinc finger protein ZPR1 [Daktulosphaira vitifoliae]|uniref:zinc finger protein ZPR1 n=1 Tax=Daktulosphaira vitifoliae TaxID=58002 RepID=UPI0021A99F43|nr:zinc finger protein ZPR1 [Daktulosphaira vitifoliae]XP_050530452.1 zinc finger protein ZPR1 [Daktulosphaira vitifoliae]
MNDSKSDDSENIFQDLDVDKLEVNVVESLCFECGKNGTTRLLLTRIPFYKELVISSFECPHCDYKNNQLDPAIEIKPQGVHLNLNIEQKVDLDRYVITTDYTCIRIPELDFEIPPQSQRAQVTTVEGIIDKIVENLSLSKEQLMETHAELSSKINVVIDSINNIKTLNKPTLMIFEDATGNIFISNPIAPQADPRMHSNFFIRSKDQNIMIGLSTEDSQESMIKPLGSFNDASVANITDEIVQFNVPCPNCNKSCDTNMKVTDIPYFKQVVIMATTCDECGYRTNEVKPGGGIEDQGTLITVKVSTPEDLNRDILKSETCELLIPELEFEAGALSLSGRFTTIEGLLTSLQEQLSNTASTFYKGDSQTGEVATKTEHFLNELEKVKKCQRSIEIVLRDPAGNSYVQSLTPPMLDSKLTIKKFDRTEEQNEELGLNDMKVDGYEDKS